MHIRPSRVESFIERLDTDDEFRREFLHFLNLCAELNHSVNNPLTGLLGFSELLQETSLSEDQASYLAELSTCAIRIGEKAAEVSTAKERLVAEFDLMEYFERVPAR